MHRRSFFQVTALGLLGAASTALEAQRSASRTVGAGATAAGSQNRSTGSAAPLVKMYKSPT